MKWWLIFQVLATWPASPQPLQIQGPFDTKEMCGEVKEQFDAFSIKSRCIVVQQLPPAVK
jgi:hypothetical protein